MTLIRRLGRELKLSERSRLFWWVASWPVGLLFFAYFWLARKTSKIEIRGDQHKGAAVYVNWHRHLPFLLVHHGKHARHLMISGAPYMSPIARWCELEGLKLTRGASGQGGQAALALLAKEVARGASAVLAVDGPSGPPWVVKPGCIELARAANVPIIPVAYRTKQHRASRTRWDRMLFVGLFDQVIIEYGAPISISAQPDVLDAVAKGLNALDPDAREKV